MANPPKDITGKRYGELRAVKQSGIMTYVWKTGTVRMACWLLQCKKKHTTIRSLASLRVSGKRAKCQQCTIERRMRK